MLSDGMATTSAVATSDEAVSEPHQGHVGLLRDHLGNWWVHHAITMETKQLEANELWTLVFDEDGVGCAAGLNPDCILFLDDIMEKTLLRRESDGFYYISEGGVCTCWTDRKRRYRTGVIAWPLRTQIFQFKVACLLVPRFSNRLFWSVQDLYDRLGMDSFQKRASKWWWHGYQAWEKAYRACGFEAFTLFTGRKAATSTVKPVVEDFDNFLPFSAVSTLGLCFMLPRMCADHRKNGGLLCRDLRRSAVLVLQGLVSALVAASIGEVVWAISLSFVREWKPPIPVQRCGHDCLLPMLDDGVVDLAPLFSTRAGDDAAANEIRQAWISALEKHGARVPLWALLVELCTAWPQKAFPKPLFIQLVWSLSTQMELVALRTMTGSLPRAPSWHTMKLHGAADLLLSKTSVDVVLVKYTQSCRSQLGTPQYLGYTGDAATVHGMKLWSGAFILPDNLCAVACPQVCCLCVHVPTRVSPRVP